MYGGKCAMVKCAKTLSKCYDLASIITKSSMKPNATNTYTTSAQATAGMLTHMVSSNPITQKGF